MVRTSDCDLAWRTLDAQYWGVPQRRRRIYAVADFGGQCAGEILFESEGLRGNIAESRETREEVAGDAGDGLKAAVCEQIAGTLDAHYYKGPGMRAGTERTVVVQAIGFDNQTGQSEGIEVSPAVRSESHGSLPCVAMCLNTKNNRFVYESQTFVIQNATRGKSQNGLGISQDDVSYTLDSLGNHAVAYPDPANTLLGKANLSFRSDADTIVYGVDCRNACEDEEKTHTIQSKANGGFSYNCTPSIRLGYAVRRLTPLECERLQGLPDNWTNIEGAKDTARYKAIGNGIAKPCSDFVLKGIAEILKRSDK